MSESKKENNKTVYIGCDFVLIPSNDLLSYPDPLPGDGIAAYILLYNETRYKLYYKNKLEGKTDFINLNEDNFTKIKDQFLKEEKCQFFRMKELVEEDLNFRDLTSKAKRSYILTKDALYYVKSNVKKVFLITKADNHLKELKKKLNCKNGGLLSVDHLKSVTLITGHARERETKVIELTDKKLGLIQKITGHSRKLKKIDLLDHRDTPNEKKTSEIEVLKKPKTMTLCQLQEFLKEELPPEERDILYHVSTNMYGAYIATSDAKVICGKLISEEAKNKNTDYKKRYEGLERLLLPSKDRLDVFVRLMQGENIKINKIPAIVLEPPDEEAHVGFSRVLTDKIPTSLLFTTDEEGAHKPERLKITKEDLRFNVSEVLDAISTIKNNNTSFTQKSAKSRKIKQKRKNALHEIIIEILRENKSISPREIWNKLKELSKKETCMTISAVDSWTECDAKITWISHRENSRPLKRSSFETLISNMRSKI